MRHFKFRLLNCQSYPQDSETAGINGIINFINELRQICESVSAVLRVEIRNLFEASENTAENTFRTDKALIIS